MKNHEVLNVEKTNENKKRYTEVFLIPKNFSILLEIIRAMRYNSLPLVLAGFMLPVLGTVAGAAQESPLIFHRAIYEVQLDKAGSKSSIADLSGRIVYEFAPDICDGFATKFRFVTRFDMEGLPPQINDQRSTSFETADGKKFRFINQSYSDQELTKEIEGSARHEADKIIIDITKPEEGHHELPLAQFPTSHTVDLLKRAEKGERFYKSDLYDGADDATKISQSVVVIGKSHQHKEDAEDDILGIYAQETAWPVTIAYFDDAQNRDGLPIYRTSFTLYKNGITRDLLMDYGEFSIRGKLVQLDILPKRQDPPSCPPQT